MPLTDQQRMELKRARFDQERLDVYFPTPLTPADWAEAVAVITEKHGDTSAVKMDSGAAWPKEGYLQTERKRRKPLHSFHPNAIEILLLNDGTGWVSEPRLTHLARKFFGIHPASELKSGVVTSEDLIKEFKGKILNSIKFAQTYLPPARSSPKPESSNATRQDYWTSKKAFLQTPAPKHRLRHTRAESLFELCSQILHELGSLEAKDPDEVARWCHLVSGVFEAGKAHAYLERDKDPQTLAENLNAASNAGPDRSPLRILMDEAFYIKRG